MNFKKDKPDRLELLNEIDALKAEVERLENKSIMDKILIAKYQAIYNYAYDSFFLNKIEINCPKQFIEVNQKALDLFGYSHAEFSNMNFFDIIDEETEKNIKTHWCDIDKNENNLFESRSNTKDGKILFIEINIVKIDINGESILLSSVRDITGKKQAQKELLIAKERAEESDKLKTAFLANISHEIRTPMNAIAGFSNLLIQDDLESATRIEYVNIINTNTNLLLRLITDIIDVSKIESGTLKIIRRKVNINRLFSNLFDVFTSELRRLNKTHIKLLYNKSLKNEDAFLISDPIRLSQILNNLIFNSIKFTDKGFVEYGYELMDDKTIKLFVRDSGIGIVEEKQDVIFEHFRQENDEVTKKNHGGTGLGLSISKKLVELLGGRIWVESKTNVGSTFCFTHPYYKIDKSLHQDDDGQKDQKLNWTGKTILLVEDSEQTINLLSLVLFETNISLLVARTAEEALHLCSTNPSIDLILLDIELPDINGIEATDALRQLRPEISIIAQSKKDQLGNKQFLESIGINHIIKKPVDRDSLFDILKLYLE